MAVLQAGTNWHECVSVQAKNVSNIKKLFVLMPGLHQSDQRHSVLWEVWLQFMNLFLRKFKISFIYVIINLIYYTIIVWTYCTLYILKNVSTERKSYRGIAGDRACAVSPQEMMILLCFVFLCHIMQIENKSAVYFLYLGRTHAQFLPCVTIGQKLISISEQTLKLHPSVINVLKLWNM